MTEEHCVYILKQYMVERFPRTPSHALRCLITVTLFTLVTLVNEHSGSFLKTPSESLKKRQT